MKLTKKLSAILLALVMVLSMTATAFAATVTLPTEGILKDHSFTAYQVFAGREEDGILSDVTAGSGVVFADFLADLKAQTAAPFMKEVTPEGEGEATEVNIFADCTTAAAVAKVLSDNNADADLAKAVAEIAYANKQGNGQLLSNGENNLADGYYLIVDTTAADNNTTAFNKALLQVVGADITISVKTDAPSVEKKVYENVKYNNNEGYGQGYNDVADYNMGDAVPFHLIGTIPAMDEYDIYTYIFHDTYSPGLDAPLNIEVYLSADKVLDAADVEVSDSFEFDGDADARTFSLICKDLKTVVGENAAGSKYVIVAYTAVLNQDAVVGLDGNPNEVKLEYSNNPNWVYAPSNETNTGNDSEDNDDDGKVDEYDEIPEDEKSPTGETPIDKVIVFTYELDTTKVDGADNSVKLEEAEFVLYRAIDNKFAVVHQCNDDCSEDCDDADKIIEWVELQDDASTLKSGDNGLFKVIGLDDGTYYLKETKAPAGYNLLKTPITVVITATTVNGQNWVPDFVPALALTNLAVTADGKAGAADKNTGIASITVANNKGATLPETGGMGTTILYAAGSLLVLGTVAMMVTKKRMERN